MRWTISSHISLTVYLGWEDVLYQYSSGSCLPYDWEPYTLLNPIPHKQRPYSWGRHNDMSLVSYRYRAISDPITSRITPIWRACLLSQRNIDVINVNWMSNGGCVMNDSEVINIDESIKAAVHLNLVDRTPTDPQKFLRIRVLISTSSRWKASPLSYIYTISHSLRWRLVLKGQINRPVSISRVYF